jgi:hypothetical protein
MWRDAAGRTLGGMSKTAISCVLALFVGLGTGFAFRPVGAPAGAPTSTCGASCAAAYSAIARALPADRADGLARAVLATPGFDYGRLAHTLGIPTNAQLRAQWRRRCDARFPDDRRSANACFRLILPSTYRHLDEPAA